MNCQTEIVWIGTMSKCYKLKKEKELLYKAKNATTEYNQ